MEPVAEIGPLMFRLKHVRVERFPEVARLPLLVLDGIAIERYETEGRTFLLVDHRTAPRDLPCRVEFWDCITRGEGEVAGLYALCDLAPVGMGLGGRVRTGCDARRLAPAQTAHD